MKYLTNIFFLNMSFPMIVRYPTFSLSQFQGKIVQNTIFEFDIVGFNV